MGRSTSGARAFLASAPRRVRDRRNDAGETDSRTGRGRGHHGRAARAVRADQRHSTRCRTPGGAAVSPTTQPCCPTRFTRGAVNQRGEARAPARKRRRGAARRAHRSRRRRTVAEAGPADQLPSCSIGHPPHCLVVLCRLQVSLVWGHAENRIDLRSVSGLVLSGDAGFFVP